MRSEVALQDNSNLLEVKDLRIYFPLRRGGIFKSSVDYLKAVDGIDFSIREGETLGLVGESGCGKTTTGFGIVRLYEPIGGEIRYRIGDRQMVDLAHLKHKQLVPYRRELRLIFQDPYSSLNPRMTVLDIVGDPLKVHKVASGAELEDRVAMLLKRVGLRPEYMRRYPPCL